MSKKKRIINYKKFSIACLVLIIAIYLIAFGIKKLSSKVISNIEDVKNIETTAKQVVIPEDKTINLIAIGDVMCHNTNFQTAYNSSSKTYDFMPAFVNVSKYIEKGDIAIGNLETTLTGKEVGYSGYPTFNSPEELGVALKNIGVDVVSTANNHCMDKGTKGVINTLDNLDNIGISHTGTNRTKEEQDTILVKDVNGMKVAFLAFTYGTNGINIPSGKEYLVNLIDKDFIVEQIELAKQQNPDIICASMHWGIEYAQKQNKNQEELADLLFQNGVDIIIGNHAHVIEPMEKRTITLDDGTEKEVFVVYSLGNLMSGQTQAGTRTSILLSLDLKKSSKTGDIKIETIDCIPIYTYTNPNYKNYKIMDIIKRLKAYDNGDKSISSTYVQTFRSELDRVTAMYEN